MIKFVSLARAATLVSLFSLATLGSACGVSSQETVSGNVAVVDHSKQALASGISWVNGTYTGCTERTGAWSVRVSGTDTMTNDALSVVKDDTGCTLTLTEVKGDQSYQAQPSIAMADQYAAQASAFAAGLNPKAFYANAKLNSLSFNSTFQITISLSDDLSDQQDATQASYSTVTSSASASELPAPDYTTSFSALTLETNAADVVQVASGSVTLNAGDHSGEHYVVSSNDALGNTFADIDAAFASGTQRAMTGSVPASELGLGGQTLPQVRSIIIRHMENGVASYEVIRITFNAR